MGKTSLRSYNRKIEKLIDRNNVKEAVAHCKFILKQFPKHLETYRLLGKAYLADGYYAEAADVFRRILTALPDNFFAHLGLSIIRENEGELDAALWHMERAYETQPSNPEIQDELRRLYGKKTGVVPPRIRLTRGALVRMYAQGELYSQAASEALAALREDPQRIDLRLILARMAYLQGNLRESAEICSQIIRNSPYCFEANRILAEILPKTKRADETPTYVQRMAALDPYSVFLNSPAENMDDKVMLDELDYQPGGDEFTQPDGLEAARAEIEDSDESIPTWLNSMVNAEETESELPAESILDNSALTRNIGPMKDSSLAQSSGIDSADRIPDEKQNIPDFLVAAGWTPSVGEVTDDHGSRFDDSDEPILAKGEIPEWILPPVEIDQPVQEDEEKTQFLEQLLSSQQLEPEPNQAEPFEELETSISYEGESPAISSELAVDSLINDFDTNAFEEHDEEYPKESEFVDEATANQNFTSDFAALDSKDNVEPVISDLEDGAPDQGIFPVSVETTESSVISLPEMPDTTIEDTRPNAISGTGIIPSEDQNEIEDAFAWLESLKSGQEISPEIGQPSSPEDIATVTPQSSGDLPFIENPNQEIPLPDWQQRLIGMDINHVEDLPPAQEDDKVVEPLDEEIIPSWLKELRQSNKADQSRQQAPSPFTGPDTSHEFNDESTELNGELEDAHPSSEEESEHIIPITGEAHPQDTVPEIDVHGENVETGFATGFATEIAADNSDKVMGDGDQGLPDWLLDIKTPAPASPGDETDAIEEIPSQISEQEVLESWLFDLVEEGKDSISINEDSPLQPQSIPQSSEMDVPDLAGWVYEEPELTDHVLAADTLAGPSPQVDVEPEIESGLYSIQEAVSVPDELELEQGQTSIGEIQELPDWLEGLDEFQDAGNGSESAQLESQPQSDEADLIQTPQEVDETTVSDSQGTISEVKPQVVLPLGQTADYIQNAVTEAAFPDKVTESLPAIGETTDDIIADLKGQITAKPDDYLLWQALGDAYMNNHQIQHALDAYQKAEELLL